jgi:ZIP family zinc transporter
VFNSSKDFYSMLAQLQELNPVLQALLATCFTWAVTALGASFVFFNRRPNRKLFDGMLGFAAGVMTAASFFSLINPAIDMSKGKLFPVWFPATLGFVTGSFFLLVLDRTIPHLHIHLTKEQAEGIKAKLPLSYLLVLAITLHNIPEGLAVGVAFGALASGEVSVTFAGAVALAIGIGIQNFPEGLAVSMPLRSEGMSRRKSFWFGQLSGFVEPVAGLIGALAVSVFQPLLPYALSFAAGAMIYVVVEEVIPESHRGGNADLATISTLVGFVFMMILDVAFG